ncbi:MAG TPA: sigma-70 family RNA polymerase sigma factor [Silvibacterium sp.]|nr:sigma-70 family RNA polymerase sigma factor [Silvibacterium sp.]
MCAADGQVTLLLRAMKNGDESAAEKLLPLVYNELHRLAKSYMRRERPDHTLQPTALINEAYLRLANDTIDWQSREHFIGVAATVMRRVLVDHARAHNAEMRGGDLQRVELDEGLAISNERSKEMIAVHDALNSLETINPRRAKIVELRYFAGFSVDAVAGVLNISPRSVEREWSAAKVWLLEELEKSPDGMRKNEGPQ